MKGSIEHIKGWISVRLRNARIQDYYYSGGDTTKHYRARNLDRLFARVIVFTLTVLSFFIYTGNFFAGLFFGGVCIYLFDRLAKRFRNLRCEKNREAMLEKEAVDRFNKLLEEKTSRDFFEIVCEMLGKDHSFTGLRIIEDNEKRPFLITGRFRGEDVGIYADKLKEGTSVKEKNLEEFTRYCMDRGLKNGIYIASGPFDYSAREYAVNLDSFNLFIADTKTMHKVFLKRGLLFPIKDLEEGLEQKILEQNEETHHRFRRILAYRRIRTYTVLGVLIAVYSVFVPYSFYYLFVSIVLFSLSLTALIKWRIEKYMEDAENSIKLDNIMDAG